jgi:hypothetical protein
MMRHANDMPNPLDIVLKKYALAERRVRECRQIVEQQRAFVARYKAADRDASSSEALLGEIHPPQSFAFVFRCLRHPRADGNAIAVMIVAVMPRVTLGHTGRELTANRATVAVFVLSNAAAIARVCASWHTEAMTILLLLGGACWIAAFAFVYGPMLLTRRGAS